VHEKGVHEKEFSIYCDNSFNSMEYAGEDKVVKSPRFSSVLYANNSSEVELCEGQIVAIISYKPRSSNRRVFVLINRYRQVRENELKKRYLPQRLLGYDTTGHSINPDCIPLSSVKAPLFVVPALDKGLDIDTFGNTDKKKAFYYAISQAKVKCSSILSYDDYLLKNNTFFSDRKCSKTNEYFNFNPFLSIPDMQNIKEMLNVQREIPEYDSSVVEAFDFDFVEDDEDANVMKVDE
jgi:hypothetical protein